MESEQLLSLSGSALAQAVSSLLETPGLYVFSDILELPNVKEVSTHPRFRFLLCIEKYVVQPVGRREPEPDLNSASVRLWLNSKAQFKSQRLICFWTQMSLCDLGHAQSETKQSFFF